MRKFLIGIAIAIGALSPVMADSLTSDQQARIAAIVGENKPQSSAKDFAIDEAKEWSKWGRNMGSALVGMAQQTGVAVEAFAKTDTGKITVMAIIFKFMGAEITNTIMRIAALFLVPVFAMLCYTAVTKMRKTFATSNIVYAQAPILFGLTTKRVVVSQDFDRSCTDAESIISLGIAACFGASLVIMVVCAFGG